MFPIMHFFPVLNISTFLYISDLFLTVLSVNSLILYFSLTVKDLLPTCRAGQVKS